MAIGKLTVLELLQPIIPALPTWWLRAMDVYEEMIPEEARTWLEANHRATFLQRAALREMRRDPSVVGNFSPREFSKQEALVLEGEADSPSLSLLLRKAVRFRDILRTCNSRTRRQDERLSGQIVFGQPTIPVVLFYMLTPGSTLRKPVIDHIGLGEETRRGFDWTHIIYRRGEGFLTDVIGPQPNFPLIPNAQVRLRKPDQAAERTGDGSGRTASEGA